MKMRRNLIQLLAVSLILVNIVVPPTLSLATETDQTAESSSQTAVSQSEDSAPDSTEESNAIVENKVPKEMESTIESNNPAEADVPQVEIEKTFDERELLEDSKTESPHPTISIKKKKLEKGLLTIQGELSVVQDQEDSERTETFLRKFVLQEKNEEQWADIKEFVLEEQQEYQLDQQKIEFEFIEEKEELKEYRLIAEYNIRTYQEVLVKDEIHRASFLLKDIEVKEKNEEQLISSFQGSVYATPSPFLAPEVSYPGNAADKYIRFHTISGYEAQCYHSGLGGSDLYSTHLNYFVIDTDPNKMKNAMQSTLAAGRSHMNYQEYLDAGFSQVMLATGYGGGGNVTFSGLTPQTDYYVWILRIYLNGQLGNPWAHTHMPINYANTTSMENGVPKPYKFRTDVGLPLTISKPTVDQANASVSGTGTNVFITMNSGTYSGPISTVPNDGIIEASSNDWQSKETVFSSLVHGTSNTNGSYNGRQLSTLKTGTRYQIRVGLKPLGSSTPAYSSPSNYFYTPNGITERPIGTATGATSVNEATATVSVNYNAGDVAAHPSSTEIEIRKSGESTWQAINNSSTPRVSNISYDHGNKKVTFNLSKLQAKTNYNVRVRVKNASGVFSNWSPSSLNFPTSGADLVIDPPNFVTTATTPTSVSLGMSGYIGDISTTDNDGVLKMTSNTSHSSWGVKLSGIVHETGTGTPANKGKVNYTAGGRIVTGLEPGTKYYALLEIKDYGTDGSNGSVKQSGVPAVYTTNSVEPPVMTNSNPPTTTTQASATFTGRYGFNSNSSLAVHPSNMEVMINTGSGWGNPLNEGTTPAVETALLGNGNLAFTLSKLEPKKHYRVAYRVKNSGGYSPWAEYNNGNGFTTNGLPLVLDPPNFVASTHTSVTLGSSGYIGDISTTDNDGVLKMTSNTSHSSWGIKLSDVIHETGTGTPADKGKVNSTAGGRTITGLAPGTKYYALLEIKDYGTNGSNGSVKQSGVPAVYTTNYANAPVLVENYYPDAMNQSSVAFSGSYQFNSVTELAAHPSDVQVIIKTDEEATWDFNSPLPSVSGIGPYVEITSPSNGNLAFKIKNLVPNKHYRVAYRVKNAGGYSNWAEYNGGNGITTKGIKLKVAPPVLDQTNATETSILMIGKTYTGDISSTGNSGAILLSSIGEAQHYVAKTGLTHTTVRGTNENHKYDDFTLTGLTPGTRYRAQVHLKDSSGATETSAWGNWAYTKNTIDSLSTPVRGTPTTANNATATFTAGYQAGGNPTTEYPAHPNQVKVYLSTDGISYDPITTTSSGPKLEADDDIDTIVKEVTFKLKGLQESTHYYVKYSVVNAGGTSSVSAPYEFDTLGRTPGFYVNEAPSYFNFGVIDYSGSELSHSLVNANPSDETFIDFENINVNSQWTLSAKLSQLRVPSESEALTGSKILLDREIKKTIDGGTTWTSVVSTNFDSVIGTSGQLTLPSDGSTSVPIVKATDIPYGKGNFRSVIPLDSVELVVPGNTGVKGKVYEGKITWTLDATA